MIGKTISHYKITRKIGEGGMGVVYEAEDLNLKRTVALKFLPVHALDDEEQRARLVREAQAAAAIEHINLNTVYEIGNDKDQTFMAMAYVPGDNLRQKIKRGGMSIDEALSYTIQVAAGLAKAHSQGIVHRDIKPANVLITDEGIVKLVDFGLAKLAGATGLTKTDSTLGTAAYMSPEQAKGQKVDHRTDIWSLGVMLYEMVTGKLPFRGEHEAVVVYSILNEDCTPPRELNPEISPELDSILHKALTKKVKDRYERVDDMLVELRALHHGTPADITGPVSVTRSRQKPAPAVGPQQFKKRVQWMVAAASLLVVAFLATLYVTRSSNGPSVTDPEPAVDSLGFMGPLALADSLSDSLGSPASDTAPPTAATSAPAEETPASAPTEVAVEADSGWQIPLVLNFVDTLTVDSTDLDTAPTLPTVAVLYLENLGGNEDAYFANGVTNDIIVKLSGLSALRVLSGEEVASYRGRSLDVRTVGGKLGVDYLVEGSLMRDRESVRASARLVQVADGTLEWSQRYDRSIEEIFSVQTEMAIAIAEAMSIEISEQQRKTWARAATTNPDAYDHYLKGCSHYRLGTKRDNQEAERSYRRALDRDANYSRAMVGLAAVYLQRVDRAFEIDPKWMEEAGALLDQAQQLDASYAELFRVRSDHGTIVGMSDKAIQAAERAVSLWPHNLPLQHNLAQTFAVAGQHDRARDAAAQCLELKPSSSDAYRLLHDIACAEGKMAEAERRIWSALKIAPNDPALRGAAARYFLSQGKFVQAAPDIAKAIQRDSETYSYRELKGRLAVLQGDTKTGIDDLRDATRDFDVPGPQWWLGWGYSADGDSRNAERAWEKCRRFDETELTINPRNLTSRYRVLWIDCLNGSASDPLAELEQIETEDLHPDFAVEAAYMKAGIFAAIGDQARAIDQLQIVIRHGYYAKAYLAVAPEFAVLQNNYDFRKLVGLQETG